MATRKKKKAGTIKVQYYRSAIGFDKNQKRVVKGLGFRKLNAVRELKDTPELRGMVAKVPHLVKILGDKD
jgi:large subunit ribosomal protein L30